MEDKDFELQDILEFTTGLEEEELPDLLTMPEDWDTYVTYLDDEKALISLDLEVAKVAPVLSYHHLLGIQYAFKNPTEDGFYTEAEREKRLSGGKRVFRVSSKWRKDTSYRTPGKNLKEVISKTSLDVHR